MPSHPAGAAAAITGATLLAALGFPAVAPSAQAAAQAPSVAQVGVVRGRVTEAGSQRPVPDAQVLVVGTSTGAVTNAAGEYTLRAPAGARVLQARRIGFASVQQSVTVAAGGEARADFALAQAASRLDQVVVTAHGRTTEQRVLGSAQQTVAGAEIAQSQRENFVNALQGRIAGVNVASTSGVPGASTSITIRGVSSISASNQPLFVVDGAPVDNKTLNTGALASGAGSGTSFENRGVDFTNRAADINPEDIESITVLKGAAAAALYGIDAANGAIVITTKRGAAGAGGFTYSNNTRLENIRARPAVQRAFGPSAEAAGLFQYFGTPYADTTRFYDNISGFFRTGVSQQHNLSFSGSAPENRVNYRLTGGLVRQQGTVPNSDYNRINLTGSSQGQVARWLRTDLSMAYTNATNDQPFKGSSGPLIGLLVWPQTDDAQDWLTPAGTRRRLTRTLSSSTEVDNPYFNNNRNNSASRNNRIIANLGLIFTPGSWGTLTTRVNSDNYTNQLQIVRHPESATGATFNGIIDDATDVTRNLNALTTLDVSRREVGKGFGVSAVLGNQVTDNRSSVDALLGRDFLDPNFVSVNNTALRSNQTTLTQRRLVGLYGQATFDYSRYLFLTVKGRNDWTSTIPQGRNSFFYPGVETSFIFSEAFPAVGRVVTGKLRGSYQEVGQDARPYAYRPALQFKTTSYGGYGYNFTGPNLNLRPEFMKEYEVGADLSFLQERLGVDVAYYQRTRTDQIVNDIRGSYATGFILFNLNGAATRNRGLELMLRGAPVRNRTFSWDVQANFERARGRVLALPNALPESYISDTWVYGQVRNGTAPGLSTQSLTGQFYLRNNQGKVLIDPATGLPIRSTPFVDAGYDRQPDYTVGLTNTLRYKRLSLGSLLDIRRGGDILNATQHYLTTRGLAMNTLDRNRPRVIDGVLRDGLQNTANPTVNNIVVVPSVQTGFYTNMSEELFIEKDINWLRLRELRLNYALPARFGRNASVYVMGTDLFLFSNYSGLDPLTNANTAAVGGSGAVGIDFGNFPIPRGFNFGITMGF